MQVTRAYLPFLPHWTLIVLYSCFLISLIVFGYGVQKRLARYGMTFSSFCSELKKVSSDDLTDRLKNVWHFAILQGKLMRTRYAGVFHWLFYGSMLLLVLGTGLVFLDEDILRHLNLRILQNGVYFIFEFVLDTAALLLMMGVLLALARRILKKPQNVESNMESYLVLFLLLYMGVSGILLEGIRLTLQPVSWSGYSYFGFFLSQAIGAMAVGEQTLQAIYYFLWFSHMLCAFLFIGSLPYLKFFHILAIPINIFLEDPDRVKAKLSTPFNLMELSEEASEEELQAGAGSMDDFSWQRKFALDACINCGRCERACPAYAAGRDLSPRQVIQTLQKELCPAKTAVDACGTAGTANISETSEPASFFERGIFQEHTPWSCTNCGACMEECPAHINHIEYMLDLRRHLVSEGKLDEKQMGLLSAVERNGNPYGLPSYLRMEWLTDMGVPTIEEKPDAEYIYWIGCAGAYDSRAQQIVRAMIRLLQHAGVSFAILGEYEKCCGEVVKRLGEEGRFQLIAMENREILQQYPDAKIVTSCPHCYNTLKHEYCDFGEPLPVIHHSMLLAQLLKEGRLQLEEHAACTVTYHDPCNLGRLNQIYDEPRACIAQIPGVALCESARNRDQGFCCGAGGDNAWYNVPEKEKISSLRIRELAETTHADILMAACPYCVSMFEDACKTEGLEGRVQIKDLAELLAEHLPETEETEVL